MECLRVEIMPQESRPKGTDFLGSAFPGSTRRLLLRVAEQHHIGFAVAADDGELFAVEGEVEVADDLGFKIGQLLAGRSIEILEPKIVGVAAAYGIDDPFAVGAESDRTEGVAELKLHASPFEFQEARRLARIKREQGERLLRIIPSLRDEGGQFSVRGNSDAAEYGKVKRPLRGPVLARNFLQNVVGVRVEHSLAIGSAGGKRIEFAGSEFFRIGSFGVD